ncbi:MAG: transketolase [Gemmatimonadetes bacterium]|nr:transketolase [Gemmatimonadota bacterium]
MSQSTPTRPAPALERLMIDAVRVLAMDAVQQANSGHPGTPMALAPLGYLTWTRHLRHDPADPTWLDRDRFVLSLGHASMLVYALLHLTGYDLPIEEIVRFRQWGSRTPGHPEFGHTPGVETTTGPLGQGVANSVGMALAERWLADRFNRPGHTIVDHRTWVFCSDGDLMEGISHEAAALAGHQKLGKLIWVFDDNRITIDGSTDLASSSDELARFASYGWHVQRVEDGNDLAAIDAALAAAAAETERPSLIGLRTVIGYGSPNLAGSEKAHGAPLGADEIRATKESLGYPEMEPFWVSPEAREAWGLARSRGAALHRDWSERFARYRTEHPELAAELLRVMAGTLPDGWEDDLDRVGTSSKADATRGHSGRVIQTLAARVPELVGGSADLAGSNKTTIKDAAPLLPDTPSGRNVFYGVREHGMGGIMNGMALHGGIRPFGGTFLIFSDYMRPSIRLASLMELPVVYVFSHDSIGLGEDGPTHQPIEQLVALRAIPGLVDLRPCDGPETAEAWRVAVERKGPSFLALTRQTVPLLDRGAGAASAEGLRRGGYVLIEAEGGAPDAVLIASGSEVDLAVQARATLQSEGIATRVVSLPSWTLFAEQSATYRDQVLPPDVRARVSIEAGSTLGWSRWVGESGTALGLDRFGASAPFEELYAQFGLTADAAVAAVRSCLRTSPAG